MSFTAAQKIAIESSGNTIVVAGAGTGKTRTLVERCARLLLAESEPVSAEEILVVTFTEAAAREVRQRLRQRLEKEYSTAPNPYLLQQIARLDSAFISTLHSFCFRLIRQHFAELEMDPAAVLLNEDREWMLFSETLSTLFREHYEDQHKNSAEVRSLILEHFGGRDIELGDLLRKIHVFTQTRSNPEGWLRGQLDALHKNGSAVWKKWHVEALEAWKQWWVPYLKQLPAENQNAHVCAALLDGAGKGDITITALILERDDAACWPKKKKGEHKKPFASLFAEAGVLASFAAPASDSSIDPLEQDWEWGREPSRLVLELAIQFEAQFQKSKSDQGVVDFHDLEQLTLRLLWDHGSGAPTELAREWQQRFKFIFVDEYQDINRAQDLILTALARANGNRFLVGDIKQSIYRFRQGDPAIFQDYVKRAQTDCNGWTSCFLSENFRSHEGVLNFVNPFFKWLMRPELGGIEYSDEVALVFGDRENRSHLAAPPHSLPAVEINLLKKTKEESIENSMEGSESDDGELSEADRAAGEAEALRIGKRIQELANGSFEIWDEENGISFQRKAGYGDMVILLRSVKNKVDAYAKAFDELGIPLELKRDAFYSTPEILDLLNLLTILDNPIQDVPLLGVLRSPLVGLDANQLVQIRLVDRQDSFWGALNRMAGRAGESEAKTKVIRFLDQFTCWRDPANCAGLAAQLETILAETLYAEWILSQPRGPQRYANLQQLIRIAHEFDALKGEGLYQFLRHVNALQDEVGDIEPAPVENSNSVRLMSIHRSKGLEFPIVFLGDLGKNFNLKDCREGTLLDNHYGLCSRIKAPSTGFKYKSLPLHLAQERLKRETVGEEMRLLYVAFTRARNLLILCGAISEDQITTWSSKPPVSAAGEALLQARSPLQWLVQYLCLEKNEPFDQPESSGRAWKLKITPATVPRARGVEEALAPPSEIGAPVLQLLHERLSFAYSYARATDQQAKSSVSAVRKSFEIEEESGTPFFARGKGDSLAIERGLANHLFLELMDLDGVLDEAGLEAQCQQLVKDLKIGQKEAAQVNLKAIARFWQSQVGQTFLAERGSIRREFPFTFQMTPADAQTIGKHLFPHLPPGDFVIIQGIADMILLRPEEVWLLDFKTDALFEGRLDHLVKKYRPQIDLYSLGLDSILHRKVTRRWLHFLDAGESVEL